MIWWAGLEVEGSVEPFDSERLGGCSEECLPLTLLVARCGREENSLNPR
jgi:hypothetical protein